MIELLAATERDVILTYILCVTVVVQASFILSGYCFGNARIRASLHRIAMNIMGRKVPPLPQEDIDSPVKSTIHSNNNPAVRLLSSFEIGIFSSDYFSILSSFQRSSLAYRNNGIGSFEAARRQIGISTSSTTSRSTNKTSSSPYR